MLFEQNMNLSSTVIERLADAPGRLALIDPRGRRFTRAQLFRRIARAAQRFEEQGMVRGDRVVLQLPHGVDLVVATLAVIARGAVPVLLEGGLGDGVYLDRIAAAQARWLVIHPWLLALGRSACVRRIAARAKLVLPPRPPTECTLALAPADLDDDSAVSPQVLLGKVAAIDCAPSDPCIVVYTGGTTQAPKGVIHSHASLRGFLDNIRALSDIAGVERLVVDTLPQALYALYLGIEVMLVPTRGASRCRRVLDALQSGQAQGYFGAPHLWLEMMRLAPHSVLPPTVRMVLLGSAPVRPRFLHQLARFLHWETRVTSLYGMTEAGPVCRATLAEKIAWTGKGDLVGAPVAGATVRVDAPDGEVGEVLLDGPSVSPGYLGQLPRAMGQPLRTGDLGAWTVTPDGRSLVLHGRIKEMVIRKGVNLYPGTLEGPILSALVGAGLPVDDCALLGEWDEARQDERLTLVVTTVEPLDLGRVRQIASQAAGPDGAPDRVVRVNRMPVKGRQNKRDLAMLRTQIGAMDNSSPADGPSDIWIPFGARELASKTTRRLVRGPSRGRVAIEALGRLLLAGVAQLTWLLDDVVAPDWRQATARGPLFIVGHQRSGTTALHRMLAADTRHMRALTLGEMVLPAVSAAWLRNGIARVDRWSGGALARLEDRLLAPMDALHRIRLGEVEEDEFVFWALFASIMVANDDPVSVAHRDLDHLRRADHGSAARLERLMRYYHDVWRRKLAQEEPTPGHTRWMVAKNPAFTQKIPALLAQFPDSRFVYLIRDPRQAIPSRLNLIQSIWQRRFPDSGPMTPAQAAVIYEDSLCTYRSAERELARLPSDRWMVVREADVRSDPSGVVAGIYAHFGLPGTPPSGFSVAPASSEVSSVAHLVETDRIAHDLADVLLRYGFCDSSGARSRTRNL